MQCNHWIVDRYSPTRKKHRIESVAEPGDDAHIAVAKLNFVPTIKWSAENLRRCTGTIHAAFDGNYGGLQDDCDPTIYYWCDYCHTNVTGPVDMSNLEEHLQKIIDALP